MSSRLIRGYFLRVNEEGTSYRGYIGEFEDSLEFLQGYVDGYIDVIPLNRGIDLVINDEGKIKKSPPNRILVDMKGQVFDIIHGNILCVRHNTDGDFTPIMEEDIPIIEKALVPLMLIDGRWKMVNLKELPIYEGR